MIKFLNWLITLGSSVRIRKADQLSAARVQLSRHLRWAARFATLFLRQDNTYQLVSNQIWFTAEGKPYPFYGSEAASYDKTLAYYQQSAHDICNSVVRLFSAATEIIHTFTISASLSQ